MSQHDLSRHEPADGAATLRVDPDREGVPIEPNLFGKFCEHLGRNIAGGMHAQTLLNPTFGHWEFPTDDDHPDGGIVPEHDDEHVRAAIRDYCDRWDIPNPTELFDAYTDGCAFGWTLLGDAQTTPDTSPEGDRAQRVALSGTGGLRQRTYLPLHRTREYELTCRLRATEATRVTVDVSESESDPQVEALASTTIDADREWRTVDATLVLPEAVAGSDEPFDITITVSGDVDLVVDRVTLYPDDHVNKADPEVIEYLRESDLPLLRYPGGNFVSGYHWQDGVGPVEERPTTVNPAWGEAESNLFGTVEFMEFCEAVGCEPMICVNAGDGTPEEAAKWVEYCNGSADTEMGALRAEHGHPEPFDVTYWEIGNELFGIWQVRWTNPSGNADRFQQFREAMLDADPDIEVQAVGNRNSPDNRWNDRLLADAGEDVRCIADHILTGGRVHVGTDRNELFHGFMGYADQLGREYRDLRERMDAAGVDDPRLAITELQLFADFERNRELETHGSDFTADQLPTPRTISEPVYAATIIFESIRMAPFVEMLTHSATVNHGGGLQKKRERTWADPVHYGHELLAPLMDATPLGVDIACDTISTRHSFGDIEAFDGVPAIDAIAAEDGDAFHVALIHRQVGKGPADLTLDLSSLTVADDATVTTLTADDLSAENTYERPENVQPVTEAADVEGGSLNVSLPACSLTRVTIPLE